MSKYKLIMFRDDMGSYTTNCNDLDDALWEINSARDHDGLKHIDLDELKRMLRGTNRGNASLIRLSDGRRVLTTRAQ